MRVRTGPGPPQTGSLRKMKMSESMLDSILDDSDSKDELFAQNGHNGVNGINGYDPESVEPAAKKQRMEGTVKGLLSNSLGTYWNDSSDAAGKRKRKQVARYTEPKKKEDDEKGDEKQKRKNPKRQSRPTSELVENGDSDADRVSLKTDSKTPKTEKSKTELKQSKTSKRRRTSTLEETLDGSPNIEKLDQILHRGNFDQDSEFDRSSQEDSEEDSQNHFNSHLSGAQRRKARHTYHKNTSSIAFHMALKPVKNFSICPYKEPSRLIRDTSRYLLSDHNSSPLVLALDVTQLIHVTQYKELLQKGQTHKFRRKNGKSKNESSVDMRRPGYSRAKEELKQLLRTSVVEREITAQQRLNGKADPEYKEAKNKLIQFLNKNYSEI